MNTHRNIYFVRHGQTDANLGNGTAQSTDSTLNQQGKQQAQLLAQRLQKTINFDLVITSCLDRAVETGTIIKEINGVANIVSIADLNERLKPSCVTGLEKTDDQYLRYVKEFKEHANDPDWRPEDGENMHDLIKRIERILVFIEQETQGDVVVVSHGLLLRIITTYLLTRSRDMKAYVHALDSIRFENTGITHVKLYTDGLWQFGSINDSTHLS